MSRHFAERTSTGYKLFQKERHATYVAELDNDLSKFDFITFQKETAWAWKTMDVDRRQQYVERAANQRRTRVEPSDKISAEFEALALGEHDVS
jgi:hypothetical protein